MNKEQLGSMILKSEDSMYRVAKTLLQNDADCADAIQESIVKAFAKIHTLKSDAHAKTWLIRILMNECYTIMRKEKKLVSIEDYPIKERAAEPHDYTDLYQALQQLPPDMRIAVTLYYMEGYSVKETAELLKVTESTVKNRLSRARTRLRKMLEADQLETIHTGQEVKL